MKDFSKKTVVITGAGSGIGRALAVEFGKLGAKLALNDFKKDGLDETVSMLRDGGTTEIYTEVFDVSDADAMFSFANAVKAQLGNAHIIINNAGTSGAFAPAFTKPLEIYRKVMDVNFFGVVHGTKAFLPQLVANNEGAVVNISSVMGLFGSPNSTDYSASNFAVRGFTEALAVEFHKSPIGIHCVHPGGTDTNINDSVMSDTPRDGFDKAFLKTPPRDLAKRIIRGIRRKELRIIYGNQSFLVWFASTFLPRKVQNRMIWKKIGRSLNMEAYRLFVKGK
ncbi:MAG: SDR family NAD(P)-dependent oxidoreductase [Cryomorphaceae bacterium]